MIMTTQKNDHQRAPRHPRSLYQRLEGHYYNLTNRRRFLFNISEIFRGQVCIYHYQCDAALERLYGLRRAVLKAYQFLSDLEPVEIEQWRPYPTMAKLYGLYYQLTEMITTIAMFRQVAEAVCIERIQTHLFISQQFPLVLASYEDLTAQFTALLKYAREQPTPQQQGDPQQPLGRSLSTPPGDQGNGRELSRE
jgi:hypothetical protein